MRTLFKLAVFCLFCASLSATTRYVATSCTGVPTPCYTSITTAGAATVPGDTVIVKNGVYNLPNLTCHGYAAGVCTDIGGTSDAARIVFKAENKWGAKLVANSATTCTGSTHCAVWLNYGTADYVDIQDFEIDGANYPSAGIDNWAAHVRIIGNHVHNINHASGCCGGIVNSGYGEADAGVYNEVTGNVVHDVGYWGTTSTANCEPHQHCIYGGTRNIKIQNNIGYRCEAEGILANHGANQVTISNNTLFENGCTQTGTGHVTACGGGKCGGGMSVTACYSGATADWTGNIITNNLLANNLGAHGYKEYDCDSTPAYIIGTNNTVSNNLFFNNAGGNILDATGGNLGTGAAASSQTTDPLFANYSPALAFDWSFYELQSGSPGINTGTPTGAPAVDIENTPRPQPTGGAYDIGAFEAATKYQLTTLVQHSGEVTAYDSTGVNPLPGGYTAQPLGISHCLENCDGQYAAGTVVVLKATGNFSYWSGAGCTGGGDCTVTMSGNKTVTAWPVLPHSTVPAEVSCPNDTVLGGPAGSQWCHTWPVTDLPVGEPNVAGWTQPMVDPAMDRIWFYWENPSGVVTFSTDFYSWLSQGHVPATNPFLHESSCGEVTNPGASYHAHTLTAKTFAPGDTVLWIDGSLTGVTSFPGMPVSPGSGFTCAKNVWVGDEIVSYDTVDYSKFTLTSVSRSGGTATYTAAGHTFLAGDTIAVNVTATPSSFRGIWTVASVGTGTFTVTQAGLPDVTATAQPATAYVVRSYLHITAHNVRGTPCSSTSLAAVPTCDATPTHAVGEDVWPACPDPQFRDRSGGGDGVYPARFTNREHIPSRHPWRLEALDTKRERIWQADGKPENSNFLETWYYCIRTNAYCPTAPGWFKLPGNTLTEAKGDGAMVYDDLHDVLILYGGNTGGTIVDSTLIMCLNPADPNNATYGCTGGVTERWFTLNSPGTGALHAPPNYTCDGPCPGVRFTHSLHWDPDSQTVVLFGGTITAFPACQRDCGSGPGSCPASTPWTTGTSGNCNSEPAGVWIYDVPTKTWTKLTDAGDNHPPTRRPAMDYDTLRHYFVIWFGPSGAPPGTYDRGTYTLVINKTAKTATWTLKDAPGGPSTAYSQLADMNECYTPGSQRFNGCEHANVHLFYLPGADLLVHHDTRSKTATTPDMWELPADVIGGAVTAKYAAASVSLSTSSSVAGRGSHQYAAASLTTSTSGTPQAVGSGSPTHTAGVSETLTTSATATAEKVAVGVNTVIRGTSVVK